MLNYTVISEKGKSALKLVAGLKADLPMSFIYADDAARTATPSGYVLCFISKTEKHMRRIDEQVRIANRDLRLKTRSLIM